MTIQDQILSLIFDLQAESGMSVILVSHDLGVVGQSCDRVAVMYAGRVVECGDVNDVLGAPRHPYTSGLLAAVPRISESEQPELLRAIPGHPPTITDLPAGCYFAPRCSFAQEACREVDMTLDTRADGHRSACPMVGDRELAEAGRDIRA